MQRVTGIGGVFFKCEDADAQRAWYRERLGIDHAEWGGKVFMWRDDEAPERRAYTVWSPFAGDTRYFEPSGQPFMLNYRVADLRALLAALRDEGVEIVGDLEEHPNGLFAWVLDPEGNKVELWEPKPHDEDPYL